MKIVLKTPYSVGDLAPDVTYPHVYITTFYVNGPGRNATISYEVGELGPASDVDPMGLWTKAVQVPSASLQIVGADLFPFFGNQVQPASPGDDTVDPPIPAVSPYLWDQVEALLYAQIQAADTRLEGKLV